MLLLPYFVSRGLSDGAWKERQRGARPPSCLHLHCSHLSTPHPGGIMPRVQAKPTARKLGFQVGLRLVAIPSVDWLRGTWTLADYKSALIHNSSHLYSHYFIL